MMLEALSIPVHGTRQIQSDSAPSTVMKTPTLAKPPRKHVPYAELVCTTPIDTTHQPILHRQRLRTLQRLFHPHFLRRHLHLFQQTLLQMILPLILPPHHQIDLPHLRAALQLRILPTLHLSCLLTNLPATQPMHQPWVLRTSLRVVLPPCLRKCQLRTQLLRLLCQPTHQLSILPTTLQSILQPCRLIVLHTPQPLRQPTTQL